MRKIDSAIQKKWLPKLINTTSGKRRRVLFIHTGCYDNSYHLPMVPLVSTRAVKHMLKQARMGRVSIICYELAIT